MSDVPRRAFVGLAVSAARSGGRQSERAGVERVRQQSPLAVLGRRERGARRAPVATFHIVIRQSIASRTAKQFCICVVSVILFR